ncbi:hypothetical protein TNCV_771791 [Trichonephila clavipes]|nr:hypothetical protein TNCV_771791 [Trichonephila clavipes]
MVKVSDRGWPCHELEPSTTKDPPCRGTMHVKSADSSNVLPCGKYAAVVAHATCLKYFQIKPHKIHRDNGLDVRLSLALALSTIQVTA